MNITTSNLAVSEPKVIYPSSQGITALPLDVSNELSQYSRLFITDEYDVFRNIHCSENIFGPEYKIYGELPDFTRFPKLKTLSLSNNNISGTLDKLITMASDIRIIQLNRTFKETINN